MLCEGRTGLAGQRSSYMQSLQGVLIPDSVKTAPEKKIKVGVRSQAFQKKIKVGVRVQALTNPGWARLLYPSHELVKKIILWIT